MGLICSKKGKTDLGKEKRDNDGITYRRKTRKDDILNCKKGSKTNKNRDIQSEFESLLDDTLITETEKQELVLLGADKKISMDFILEMKEAFLFSDKVI